ncbi:MAG TPA: hypothetical protein VNN73_00870 [Blastocatellia bacterium]|nr:hypothetical protein [Blastocatellia bacterium]
MNRIKHLLFAALAAIAVPVIALGQTQAQPAAPRQDNLKENGIGLAPARFELLMLPGTEKTVIVNIIYNAGTTDAKPVRLVATLGDWTILANGEMDYQRAGARADSAAPWMIHSPSEVTAVPGKVHPVRVTISVPKDAKPGDHLAALFVESRPDNIKLDQQQRQVVLRFRLAALFYIMVPQLTREGSLQDLKAKADEHGLIITPTIKNGGNSHIRPVHSIKVIDSKGAIVAEYPECESLPVLGGVELSRPILIENNLPPGNYAVHYRVDFKDGGRIVEGQTDLIVENQIAQKKQH